VRLFFLEMAGARPLSQATASAPITGLDHVVISTDEPERAAALYGARLGMDMSLDLSRPDWGARLLFFRCGDLVVEIVHHLNEAVGGKPDKLWGLSWRVADVDAAQARMAAAGLDVSEVRTGRRPGTRVYTVRTGALGVPTLVIQPEA
jgi:catechol 2,3-dioxygenase-like lactoylglutathione lyase family enzyme